jgi:peptidoglycan/LPS O-acetylase OafA/YrhL
MVLLIVLMSTKNLQPTDTVQTGLANLLLVHAWIPWTAYFGSFNAPSWSVSTELGFYLLFPLLIVDLRRTWAWKLALSLVLLVGLGVLANSIARQPLLKESGIHVYGLVYVSPLARLFEFVLGMCTCLLWLRLRTSARLTTRWCTVGEVAAIGLTIALLAVLGANARLWTAWLGEAGRTWLVHGGGAAPGFAAIILIVAMQRGLVARALSWPVLVVLGEISYSIYLVHQSLIKAGITYPWFATLPGWFTLPTFLVVTLLLAYLIWRFVEYPARQALVGLVGGSATQRGASWLPRSAVPRSNTAPASPAGP